MFQNNHLNQTAICMPYYDIAIHYVCVCMESGRPSYYGDYSSYTVMIEQIDIYSSSCKEKDRRKNCLIATTRGEKNEDLIQPIFWWKILLYLYNVLTREIDIDRLSNQKSSSSFNRLRKFGRFDSCQREKYRSLEITHSIEKFLSTHREVFFEEEE